MKQTLIDFYNRRIVAGWYRSAALIGGWLTSGILFAPDLLQFVVDHWDVLGGFVLPTFSVETKALVLAVYVNFLAPPLRAWVQKTMREAEQKQQAAQAAAVAGKA